MCLSIRFCCPVNTFTAPRNNSSPAGSHTPIMSLFMCCVCAQNYKSLHHPCVLFCISLISSSAPFFPSSPVYPSFGSLGCCCPGGLLSSQRVMAGEIGVPWARLDTMYGIMCVGVWIVLAQSYGNCF